MNQWFTKHQVLVSRIATIILFLALIRCIAEPFRLDYYADHHLTFEEVKPYILGAIVALIGVILGTIATYFSKYKLVPLITILALSCLIYIKIIFKLP